MCVCPGYCVLHKEKGHGKWNNGCFCSASWNHCILKSDPRLGLNPLSSSHPSPHFHLNNEPEWKWEEGIELGSQNHKLWYIKWKAHASCKYISVYGIQGLSLFLKILVKQQREPVPVCLRMTSLFVDVLVTLLCYYLLTLWPGKHFLTSHDSVIYHHRLWMGVTGLQREDLCRNLQYGQNIPAMLQYTSEVRLWKHVQHSAAVTTSQPVENAHCTHL